MLLMWQALSDDWETAESFALLLKYAKSLIVKQLNSFWRWFNYGISL